MTTSLQNYPLPGLLPSRGMPPVVKTLPAFSAQFSVQNPALAQNLTPPNRPPIEAGHLATAGLLFTLGLATHHLPGKALKPETFKFFLPPDWKSWARVGLGVATVGQLNQGMNWKPPAWLTGIESAAVITPMALRFSKASGLTVLLVAPLVAGIVQTSQWANQAFVKDLKQQLKVPEPLSRLMISLTVGGLGILGSLLFHRQIRNLPVEKLPLKQYPSLQKRAEALKKNLTEILGPSMMLRTCPRGCSPSIICLSEIGEIVGGMWHWFQGQTHATNNSPHPIPTQRR
ncbi:hypothetical protein [Vampirovibrio sp.]|uniref:hypothetical protein n=1 Tax=Vampirovibrio sp. TaxID=2717857 RepID=UPI003593AEE6